MGKRYKQECPVAQTLDVIGEKWTLLVLRDLFLHGPRRFRDFEQSLMGIAPNTLSARLKSLEASGVITDRFYTRHPPRPEYLLTDKGRKLGPVLAALRDWGEEYGETEA